MATRVCRPARLQLPITASASDCRLNKSQELTASGRSYGISRLELEPLDWSELQRRGGLLIGALASHGAPEPLGFLIAQRQRRDELDEFAELADEFLKGLGQV